MKQSNVPGCCRTPRGFTLIELLTVIAIIALLIGILVPSLSGARDSAKKVRTKAVFKACGDGLAMFAADNERELKGQAYPTSYGNHNDPTANESTFEIWGGQWLVRYLMGKDLNGYISPRNVPTQYWGTTVGYEQAGWYPGDPGHQQDWKFDRSGPYLTADGVTVKAPKDLPGSAVDSTNTSAQYNNLVLVDPFDMPICYYAANTRHASSSNPNIATHGSSSYPGIYDHGDNALFTGGCAIFCNGNSCINLCYPGWDYGNGWDQDVFNFPAAWNGSDPPNWAQEIVNYDRSFPYYIMNKDAYSSTNRRAVVPYRRDTFLMISPGKDGKFGTGDDITNFD